MATSNRDPFHAQDIIDTPLGRRTIYRLDALGDLSAIPYSIRVLLESCLRGLDGHIIREQDVQRLAAYDAAAVGEVEIPFMPGRVILQDFTGVPAVVDLAAMREAIVSMTGDPTTAAKVSPLVPCDLVIDHSVQVDAYDSPQALTINSRLEFQRNRERYEFLKWGQRAFANFRVVPPATGIVHQVNLEYLAKVVWDDGERLYPDSLVGTDSHTTMINGLGVVGWGVGGIEAEAVMLGQPIYMLIPEVVGVRLTGRLAEGCTATDLVLRITELLRKHGVVNKFVEFYGPGLDEIPLANRATIANMAPEYGATIGFFPVDDQTLKYLRLSGRDEALIAAVEQYYKLQGLWRDESKPVKYSAVVELDLATIVPSLAGPKRPQDRIALTDMQPKWRADLTKTFGRPEGGAGAPVEYAGHSFELRDGHVCIAAITSCTNTSNPSVLVAAGLVARKAAARGLHAKPWVKTSLAPGSKVVTEYLGGAGLLADLEEIGFFVVGYGCTTCIGNSGPLPDPISAAINQGNLVATSVLSGNRNFEGRISPDIRANYLASPPLVVAYALAGTVDIDLQNDPIGTDRAGQPVYLRDIWPTEAEIESTVATCLSRDNFTSQYADVFAGSAEWQAISTAEGARYTWDDKSTYIQEPPFFVGLSPDPKPIASIIGARVLLKLGDSVTTDHISPAGSIKKDSPAGKFLVAAGVEPAMFNSYGARRGNDRVMTRGTFANSRIRNQIAPGTEGSWTTDVLDGQVKPVYDAAMHYREVALPTVVLAGKDYGMGSSRDWAAKGTYLLGVRAVIAESYERIHRSNLVFMGVLPLTYQDGHSADSLGLDGTETFDIELSDQLQPRQDIHVRATRPDGRVIDFVTTCRVDTPVEVDYYRNGGILHTVLRKMARA
ncbi:MAG: aconitate hydratase AcnA [Nannocystis sp.]|nr:aconitate hydratase AcnA [Nannocystis sp.]